jgi:hypothetical protein
MVVHHPVAQHPMAQHPMAQPQLYHGVTNHIYYDGQYDCHCQVVFGQIVHNQIPSGLFCCTIYKRNLDRAVISFWGIHEGHLDHLDHDDDRREGGNLHRPG